MNLYDFADIIGQNLVIVRPNNQENRFYATFEHCEVKQGSGLISGFGNGKTPIEALNAYRNVILGQRLVFHAYPIELRQEFVVPKQLEDLA